MEPQTERQIELLAPARDYPTAVAAIDAGADALYMGGARFGARAAAGNSTEEFRRAADYAHRFGARLYATVNTVLFDDELEAAERQVRALIDAGADALIVQDMALRRMALPVELHASTQTHNVTPEGVRFLGECGFARVILERNLSIDDIRAIRAASGVELECFVHGAVCVGYSGRCFLSRSMHPARSGNRGACSQPCRLPYDLVDASGRRIVTGKHLLSVCDLNLTRRLGELLDAGVSSFKIEGRLKERSHVRNVVAWYRAALDRELALRPGLKRASAGTSVPDFTPDPSRGFTRGDTELFFAGRQAGVASFDTPKSVGAFVGRVDRMDVTGFWLDRDHDLVAGDGICFADRGTYVHRVAGRRVEPDRMEGLRPGMALSRNFDLRFSRLVERSRMRRTVAVRAEARFGCSADGTGQLMVRYTDSDRLTAECFVPGPFAAAEDGERMTETLRTQLARSGETMFAVAEVTVEGPVRFVPVSQLAEARRTALRELTAIRLRNPRPQRILPDDPSVRAPWKVLGPEANVTNRLAEAFWRAHGVEHLAPPLERAPSTAGSPVMRSRYCLRRELGACLRSCPPGKNPLKEPLFLLHGPFRYRLDFDCAQCEMVLVDVSESPKMVKTRKK